ncbi:MAG TPA: AAA family ATPase [bacterium]
MEIFDDIIGQETAKRFVQTAMKKDRLYNILLIGPKGVGKRMFGFAMAKAMGCHPRSSNFILIGPVPAKLKDKDEKLQEYMKKYLPEHGIVDIEDRESILIGQIRHLIGQLVHMPMPGSHRVVLILETDKMTNDAANCFLKTLEEPPIDTLFILTSSRPDFLLPTIRSRCQIVPFNYLSASQIQDIVFDAQDSFMLGSPGDIMRLRESEMFDKTLEIFKQAPMDDGTAVEAARELERKNLSGFFYELMLLYRQVLYHKLGMRDDIPFEKEIVEKARSLSPEDAIALITELNNCINSLDSNANHLLLVANILLKLR